MIAEERRKEIIKIINEENAVKVKDLSKAFKVTDETIRSDLNKLEEENLLKRTHGGAIAIDTNSELSFHIRENKYKKEKKEIAKRACQFINPGDTIFMDASTTCLYLAKELIDFEQNINIITNSNRIVYELSKNENISVISTGGLLRRSSLSFVGPLANKNINNYYANKAFLSCKGISVERGATEINELETETKSNMVKRANEVIILANHTAFNEIGLSQFATLDEIDKIITDSSIEEEIIQKFGQLNKEIIKR
ncbi:DeoR family transcriptional regulator [Orenia metallireducens]|jgi:DeoR family fructose operon transcriptional repressor|uniref:Transcriptional regulator, DeoR family n=1 Tax=Orenia metallireducens TaxID=1413210 RepID=A0A285HHR9_9FIRM|nr:DeoR/GlpR family DNA-binding transcription regulator [Orenia metallireducens]PRX27191.1 DeoR family transcriptional regulator [Orenia metallireducens]SNY35248.1 transcriptional regulator, DeoR family [Orenia metallireducens]